MTKTKRNQIVSEIMKNFKDFTTDKELVRLAKQHLSTTSDERLNFLENEQDGLYITARSLYNMSQWGNL